MTYKNIIASSFRDNSWNYYCKDGLTLNDCSHFIKDCFTSSEKNCPDFFSLIDSIEGYDKQRLPHIVNTFLLGNWLYNESLLIQKRIDAEIKRYEMGGDSIPFIFCWFLICLLHDLGYSIEYDKESQDEYLASLNDFHLSHIAGVPKCYRVYRQYLSYIVDRFGIVDHGIYAGLYFYKLLCRIRREKEREGCSSLNWHKSLEKVYNYCCWIVLSHNMWFATSPFDQCIYRHYKLEELCRVGQDYSTVSVNNHPMLFLFMLVDSIEPEKIVQENDLLDQIDMVIDHDSLIVSTKLGCGCGKVFIKRVCDLNNWLTKTEQIDDNTVKVMLNPHKRRQIIK